MQTLDLMAVSGYINRSTHLLGAVALRRKSCRCKWWDANGNVSRNYWTGPNASFLLAIVFWHGVVPFLPRLNKIPRLVGHIVQRKVFFTASVTSGSLMENFADL